MFYPLSYRIAIQHRLIDRTFIFSESGLSISWLESNHSSLQDFGFSFDDMAPVDRSPCENMGGFELICSLKAEDMIPVHMYKSTNTGLTVCIAEIDGPVVTGFFSLGKQQFLIISFHVKFSFVLFYFCYKHVYTAEPINMYKTTTENCYTNEDNNIVIRC